MRHPFVPMIGWKLEEEDAMDAITRESAVNDELRREIAAVRELIYAD